MRGVRKRWEVVHATCIIVVTLDHVLQSVLHSVNAGLHRVVCIVVSCTFWFCWKAYDSWELLLRWSLLCFQREVEVLPVTLAFALWL
jgi:hypothetical protein